MYSTTVPVVPVIKSIVSLPVWKKLTPIRYPKLYPAICRPVPSTVPVLATVKDWYRTIRRAAKKNLKTDSPDKLYESKDSFSLTDTARNLAINQGTGFKYNCRIFEKSHRSVS